MVKYEVTVFDRKFLVDVREIDTSTFEIEINGKRATIKVEKCLPEEVTVAKVERAEVVRRKESKAGKKVESAKAEGRKVTAPMTGVVTKILKKEGEKVEEGENVLIIEAMKMENPIPSPQNGIISAIAVNEGDKVSTGDVLFYVRS